MRSFVNLIIKEVLSVSARNLESPLIKAVILIHACRSLVPDTPLNRVLIQHKLATWLVAYVCGSIRVKVYFVVPRDRGIGLKLILITSFQGVR